MSNKRVALSTLLLASSLVLTSCSAPLSAKVQTAVPGSSEVEPTPDSDSTGLPTLERFDKVTGFPIISVGMFDKAISQTATGTESTVIEFEKGRPMSALWTLDCPDCTGPITVQLADPDLFLWNMTGPVSDSSWISPVDVADVNSLTVVADGEWTIGFTQWTALKELEGSFAGYGPKAFRVPSETKSITLSYTETAPGDVLHLSAWKADTFLAIPASTLTGTATQTFELDNPYTVFINASGNWESTLNS